MLCTAPPQHTPESVSRMLAMTWFSGPFCLSLWFYFVPKKRFQIKWAPMRLRVSCTSAFNQNSSVKIAFWITYVSVLLCLVERHLQKEYSQVVIRFNHLNGAWFYVLIKLWKGLNYLCATACIFLVLGNRKKIFKNRDNAFIQISKDPCLQPVLNSSSRSCVLWFVVVLCA